MVVYIKILCKLKLERMDQMEDVERKLELTRYLRQEQNLNRMKVKIGKTFCTERVKQ